MKKTFSLFIVLLVTTQLFAQAKGANIVYPLKGDAKGNLNVSGSSIAFDITGICQPPTAGYAIWCNGPTGSSISIDGAAYITIGTGAQGPPGPQGNQGNPGATGATGVAGIAGATGPQGIAGPAGAQGPQGIIGPPGPKGLIGATGAPGTQGPVGLTGPAGTIGATGATGSQGLPGAQGPPGIMPPTFACTFDLAMVKVVSNDITGGMTCTNAH